MDRQWRRPNHRYIGLSRFVVERSRPAATAPEEESYSRKYGSGVSFCVLLGWVSCGFALEEFKGTSPLPSGKLATGAVLPTRTPVAVTARRRR